MKTRNLEFTLFGCLLLLGVTAQANPLNVTQYGKPIQLDGFLIGCATYFCRVIHVIAIILSVTSSKRLSKRGERH